MHIIKNIIIQQIKKMLILQFVQFSHSRITVETRIDITYVELKYKLSKICIAHTRLTHKHLMSRNNQHAEM